MNTLKSKDHRMLMNGLIHNKSEKLKWRCKIFQSNKNQNNNTKINNEILMKVNNNYYNNENSFYNLMYQKNPKILSL